MRRRSDEMRQRHLGRISENLVRAQLAALAGQDRTPGMRKRRPLFAQ
jgi:hypothetical protein